MPAYGTAKAIQLDLGETATVWSAETPTPGATMGATSLPIALANIPGQTQAISASIAFSGAPGTFEVDLLTSDADSSGPASTGNLLSWSNYVQKATVTAVNASNVARLEVTGIKAKFCALQLVSRTNSVSATATVTA